MHIIVKLKDRISRRTARSVRRPASRRRFAFNVLQSVAVLSIAALAAGCDQSGVAASANGGDPRNGARLIGKFGCGTCHTIPGIADADGLIGPPLNAIGRRGYLAGKLQNTPDNMAQWLRDPQAIVPGNVMPNMGVNPKQARDITAYLYTLR
ncbi:MAG: c-type cytochrome [Proteobacteria bacterium]|nr:c-type cytochrome [Pseudomonadota bacterium]